MVFGDLGAILAITGMAPLIATPVEVALMPREKIDEREEKREKYEGREEKMEAGTA